MIVRSPHRRLASILGAVLLGATVGAAPVAAAEPDLKLPDLAMEVPSSFRVCAAPTSPLFQTENCPDPTEEDRWLRFDSLIMNLGPGTFRVVAKRASIEQTEMHGVQWIRTTAKTWMKRQTDAILLWAEEEDGHPHWHTQGVEKYRLFRLPTRWKGPAKVGVKRGYCFFDGFRVRPNLPNARPGPFYTFYSCGVPSQSQDALKLRVGISVGWGDEYPWNYAGQRVNLRNAGDGKYLLCLTADPLNQFLERREGNNESWARIRLTTTGSTETDDYQVSVEVLKTGRTPCHDQLPYDIKHLPLP